MIYLRWDATNMRCDWSATGTALETAVLLAVFTDRIASPDYKPLDGDPRGHWSDAYTGQLVGSNLWELDRAKMTDANVALAQNSVQIALQPLIDAGVASAVDVIAQRQGQLCAMKITITAPNGQVETFRYGWAWAAVAAGMAQPPSGGIGPVGEWDASNWDDGSMWTS